MNEVGIHGYGLDSHGVEIRCPVEAKDVYVLHSDQTGCAVNQPPVQWTLEDFSNHSPQVRG